jgi:hypothetical protein
MSDDLRGDALREHIKAEIHRVLTFAMDPHAVGDTAVVMLVVGPILVALDTAERERDTYKGMYEDLKATGKVHSQ